MVVRYADPSALVRAYLEDEPEHEHLRASLLESDDPVLTSELARVEIASGLRAASRAGRIGDWRPLLGRIDANWSADGPITLLELHPPRALRTARRLVTAQRLRTLDAIHLAVALEDARAVAGDDPFVFVTRDADQAAAAAALGLAVA